jgi:hypothetical protein
MMQYCHLLTRHILAISGLHKRVQSIQNQLTQRQIGNNAETNVKYDPFSNTHSWFTTLFRNEFVTPIRSARVCAV